MYTTFAMIPLGATFHCGGNLCVKRSTRTALLTAYNRSFYFAANTLCKPLNYHA